MARSEVSEEDESPVGLIYHLYRVWRDTLLTPFRILTSKFAIKAYITSLLYVGTALALFFLAVAAYTTFYWTYIPRIGFERTLHLQFDPISSECLALESSSPSNAVISKCTQYPHPWASVDLSPELISQQRYDISIELTMPRTPTNTQAGNFMLDAALYAPSEKGVTSNPLETLKSGLMLGFDSASILARARRPAIMTYYSKEVELMHKTSQLHWFWLGVRREAETISVSLFEGVEFEKGWRNVPGSMRIEVQAQRPRSLQFYDAKVVFKARFRGLRWIMYNHRIISAVVFIASFWATEMVFASAAWVVLSWIIFGGGDEDEETSVKVKREQDVSDDQIKEESKMSDTERSFPTYGSQPPLRYTSPIKKEEPTSPDLLSAIPLSNDADIEDEDADFVLDDAERWRDSGLGTSMESSGGRNESIRRRRSKQRQGTELL